MLWRTISIVGLLLLVLAYLVNQAGRTSSDSRRYLLANACGAGLLTAYSAIIGEWVFVSLEGFWCLASLWALRRPVRARAAPPCPPVTPGTSATPVTQHAPARAATSHASGEPHGS
jgi:hypothetical protein